MLQPKVTAQEPARRARNFQEVSLGYSKKQALDEARRCPQCANPTCLAGCPLGIDIPGFIRHIRESEPDRALAKIKEDSMFASICGRLCPAPCEAACVFYEDGAPIGIRALERYAADHGHVRVIKKEKVSPQAKKIAIIGSGPSGLAAAAVLSQDGYQVTVFEFLSEPGGILRYGVPEFRFPKRILNEEIAALEAQGVLFRPNVLVGQTVMLSDFLKEGYSSVLLSLGAGTPNFLDIPGTSLGGVTYADEFLLRSNLLKGDAARPGFSLKVGYRVVVIGSGHTALDCARSVLRLGRDVTLMFRRTEDDVRAPNEEKEYAKEEGLKIEPLTRPLEILGNEKNFVCGIKCVRMDFADKTGTGSWELIEVPDSAFIMEADSVVIAVGHQPNSQIIKKTPLLKINPDGTIWTEASGMTSIAGVFACGSIAYGPDSVIRALAAGKAAAKQMDRYLTNKI